MSGQPSVSLRISNLNHQITKVEIRRSLYSLFSLYGKVIDVVHTRSAKVRGTGFVVFRDLASSTQALRALDGETFYGRQLRIAYAQSTSHATIAESEGAEVVYQIKLGLRTAGEAKAKKLTVSAAGNQLAAEQKKRARDEANEEEEEEESEDDEPATKKGKQGDDEGEDDDAMDESSDEDEDDGPQSKSLGAPQPAAGTTPNPVLFAQGLPSEVTTDMLSALFGQYAGLATVKMLPTPAGSGSNRGIAFVHYENVAQAETAREALDGFLLAKGAPLGVAYAQRG